MSRVYNFSAGPAVLPEPVLKEVAGEMMDYQGTGMSVMEMSHRSPEFQKIIDDAEQDLRDLMKIPDNYKVLFLQGGASQQFAMIPMNLMKNRVADYIVTGQWAKKAYQEAQKYGKVTEDVLPGTPTMLTYKTHADAGSLYNTPNAYCIYVCGKVFKWLKAMGGLEEMQKRNIEKAKILYDYLDQSKLFKGTVEPNSRSLMNVPFVTGDKDMDAKFVKEAKAAGLVNLKGHRTVGGMRASIYNAMPKEGVEALVAFMKKFEEENV